jgi:VCBS repeat-containing protein
VILNEEQYTSFRSAVKPAIAANKPPLINLITTVASGGITEDGSRLFASGQITAVDQDAGDILRYELLINGLSSLEGQGIYGSIALDPNTGRWRYDLNNRAANVQALTSKNQVNDSFLIRAVDSFGAFAKQEITINITGADESPSALNLIDAKLYKGQVIGDIAGTAKGEDLDSGSNLRYFLIYGTYNNFLNIDPLSGQLIISQDLSAVHSTENPRKNIHAIQIGVTDNLSTKIDNNGYLLSNEPIPTSAILKTFVLTISAETTPPTNTAPSIVYRSDTKEMPSWLVNNRERTVLINELKPGSSSASNHGVNINQMLSINSNETKIQFLDFNTVADVVGNTASMNDEKLAGLAIISNSSQASEGQWQYRTVNSSTWTNLPIISSDQPFIILNTDLIRFVPAPDYAGVPGALEARVLDNSVAATPSQWVRGLRSSSGPLLIGDSAAASEQTFLITTRVQAAPTAMTLKLQDSIAASGVTNTTDVGTLLGELNVTDADTDLANISFTLAGTNNENSAVRIDGNRLVLNTPSEAQLADSVIRLQIQATDSDGNSTPLTTLFVPTSNGSANAAPTLSANDALLASQSQVDTKPGASVLSLFSTLFADVDGDPLAGIAIVQNDALRTQGAWQYKDVFSVNGQPNSSESWKSLPAVSSASIFTLKATSGLRFISNNAYYGNPGALTVHLLDNSKPVEIGSGVTEVIPLARGNASAQTATLSTTITYWNKKPTGINLDSEFGFGQAETNRATSLIGVDNDSSSSELVFSLDPASNNADHAYVELDANGILRLKNLNNDQLLQIEAQGYLKLKVRVADGSVNGLPDPTRVFTRELIVPVLSSNLAPSIRSATAATTETPSWISPLTPQSELDKSAYLTAISQGATSPSGNRISALFNGEEETGNNRFIDAGEGSITFGGIAITANAAADLTRVLDGTWQYDFRSDGRWVKFPNAISSTNPLILPKSASIRFLPSRGFSGEPGGLTVHLLDNSKPNLFNQPKLADGQTFVIGGSAPASSQTLILRTYVTAQQSAPTALFFKPSRIQLDANQAVTAPQGGLEIGRLSATDTDTTTQDLVFGIASATVDSTPIGNRFEVVQDRLMLKAGESLTLAEFEKLQLRLSVKDPEHAALVIPVNYGETYSAESQGYVIRALPAGGVYVPPTLKSDAFSLPQTGAAENQTQSSVGFAVAGAINDVQLSMTSLMVVDYVDVAGFRSDDPQSGGLTVNAIEPVTPALNFTLSGLTPGETVRLEFEIPNVLVRKYAARTDARYVFDYLKTSSDGTTYNFYFDEATGTGAKLEKVVFIKDLAGNPIFDPQTGEILAGTFSTVLAVYIQDGGRGDDDGIVNGAIVDPGLLTAIGYDNTEAGSYLTVSLNSLANAVGEVGLIQFTNNADFAAFTADPTTYLRTRSDYTQLFGLVANNSSLAGSALFKRVVKVNNNTNIAFIRIDGGSISDFRIRDVGNISVDNIFYYGPGYNSNSVATGLNLALSGSANFDNSREVLGSFSLSPDLVIFDMSGKAIGTSFSFNVNREAVYDSVAGLYKLYVDVNANDQNIDSATDGAVWDYENNRYALPGASNYIALATDPRNAWRGLSLSTSNFTQQTFTSNLPEQAYFAPYVRVLNTGATYFAFRAANADGAAHIVSFGSNLIGIEDLPGGGDQDFDDLMVWIT